MSYYGGEFIIGGVAIYFDLAGDCTIFLSLGPIISTVDFFLLLFWVMGFFLNSWHSAVISQAFFLGLFSYRLINFNKIKK